MGLQLQRIEPPVNPIPVEQVIQQKQIKECALVVRDRGAMPPPDMPAFYVNHCLGYKGGRVDGVFLSGGQHLLKDVNKELLECLEKTDTVFLIHGCFQQLIERSLPSTRGKTIVLDPLVPYASDVTSGCVALSVLSECGVLVKKVGFTKPLDRINNYTTHPVGHKKGLFYDVVALDTLGEFYEG
jgi:hypothetical protein